MTSAALQVGSSEVGIRPARRDDLGGILELGARILPEAYVSTGLLPQSEVDALLRGFWSEAYLGSVVDGTGDLIVATIDGGVVGMAEVGRLDGRQAILWKLYIESAVRGSGLGAAMLSLAESRLEADTDDLFTEFVTGNEGAERFYLAHGFHFDRVEPDQRDGIEATYTWLKKDLRLRSASWTG